MRAVRIRILSSDTDKIIGEETRESGIVLDYGYILGNNILKK